MRRSLYLLLSRVPNGLLTGAICASLVALLSLSHWLDGAEGSAIDLLFQARGVRAPDPRISLVVADSASVKRWPIPRRLYAQVISRLTSAGARVIACDLLFSVPSDSPRDDAALERACRESGRVVQATAFHVPLFYNPDLPANLTSDRRTLPLRFSVKDEGASASSAVWASSALPQLQESASAVGHLNVHHELDGTLRRIPHLVRYRDHVYPSLALAASARFLGLEPNQIVGERDGVRLATQGNSRFIPLDADGQALLNWNGGNEIVPTYNFNQLLSGEVPTEALKDHLIFVGVTAAGAYEHQPTPFSSAQPAIELQANAASNILQNQPLRPLGESWCLFVLFGVSLFTGMVTARRRALGATLWALFILFAVWEVGVFTLSHGLYIPIGAPLLGALLTYSVTIATSYRREWESNWRTDASVSALARGGSLMASGREREALLNVISQTAREVLGAHEVFLVLEGAPPLIYPSHAQTFQILPEIMRCALSTNQVLIWPTLNSRASLSSTTDAGSPKLDSTSTAELDSMFQRLSRELLSYHQRHYPAPGANFHSMLGAPLVGAEDTNDVGNGTLPRISGILLATGRQNGLPFTARDAVLLQTLAEQASLALSNLGYYELLQGRVELANRNLRQAYDVLSDERTKLSEERTKLAAAVQSMESALVISDETDLAVFDNGMGQGILWDAAPLLGQSVPDVLLRHQLPEISSLFQEIKSGADGATSLQKATIETVRVIPHEQEELSVRRVLAAQLTPLVAENGHHLGSMLVVSDVTAERELEQMKSEFVSFVAHELRTPLTSINGFATLLRLHSIKLSEDQRVELLGSIESQCSRLNRMISDLLEVARLEPGHGIELRLEMVDLVALCRKVLTQLEVLIQNPQKLSLRMKCELTQLYVQGDGDRLEQIVINLISNAIKYSPDGGRVTLKLNIDEQRWVRLQVSDTGMGMTNEQVEHLFQKYYRTTDAQSRGIKGTGLGLYLVKQLVEAHSGNIEVFSSPGRGTTFVVALPLASE